MSGPSDKAMEAAHRGLLMFNGYTPESCMGDEYAGEVASVMRAAHDPALGLDRSVCLRDVVEALRWEADGVTKTPAYEHGGLIDRAEMESRASYTLMLADAIEREFGQP